MKEGYRQNVVYIWTFRLLYYYYITFQIYHGASYEKRKCRECLLTPIPPKLWLQHFLLASDSLKLF